MTSTADSRARVMKETGVAKGTPRDNGWSMWTAGVCSVGRCTNPSVAAIQRSRGSNRPTYPQAYCAEHARARGVERRADELVWTAKFWEPRAIRS